jgi:hypothetical protein
MKVKVLSYSPERHEITCDMNGTRITVDPFVSCAIDTGQDKDWKAIGFSLVGKEYDMEEYFIYSGGIRIYLPGYFKEIKL